MTPTSRSSLGVAAVLVFLAASAILMLAAGNLFPLTEYRDWLSWADSYRLANTLQRMFTRQDWFSRDFSMAMVHISSQVCGLNLRCLNAWTLAPLALATPLIVILGCGTGAPMRVAAASAALWLFSWPTLDTLAWQATVHDRWALFFVLAAICLAVWAYPQPMNMWRKVGVALASVVLTWLANNCKEASWFLAPTLMLIAWAVSTGPLRQRTARTLIAFPALAYTTWHVASFYIASHRSGTVWLAHVADGDVFRNIKMFSGALLGFGGSVGLAVAFTLTVIQGVSCLRYRRHYASRTSGVQRCDEFPLWPLWSGFALAVLIPLRTTAPAAYNMLIAEALFVVLLVEWVRRAVVRRGDTRWVARADLIAICLTLAMMFSALAQKKDRYVEAQVQSRNFQDSLRVIGALSPSALREPPYFLHHPAAVRAPWLLRSEDWRSLWRFIPRAGERAEPVWLRKPVEWAYTWGSVKRPVGDLRTYLYYDEHMKLSSIDAPTIP